MLDVQHTLRLDELDQFFTGRVDALTAFYSLLSIHRQQNAIYYFGIGGIGKTWLFAKIRRTWNDPPRRFVSKTIDFYDTGNKSIETLMNSIVQEIEETFVEAGLPVDSFSDYHDARKEYNKLLSQGDVPSGLVELWRRRLEIRFFECCNRVVQGKFYVLLFDTFELVQKRDVGRWFLKEFVPKMENFTIAVAGRPPYEDASEIDKYEKELAQLLPGNMMYFRLRGLSSDEVIAYFNSAGITASEATLLTIADRISGRPLILYLVAELANRMPARESVIMLADLAESDAKEIEQKTLEWVVNEVSPRKNVYAALMAMVQFPRRFDRDLLVYTIKHNQEMFQDSEDDPETVADNILSRLAYYQFIKSRPELENGRGSYLLHDEMLQIIRRMKPLFAEVPGLSRRLFNTIVNKYYPELIEKFEKPDSLFLRDQLRAEQMGYVLDTSLRRGLALYYQLIQEARKTNFGFEELLWNEIRTKLDPSTFPNSLIPDDIGYELSADRGAWLFQILQNEKAADQYKDILVLYPSRELFFNSGRLGHALMRQGNQSEAQKVFSRTLDIAEQEKNPQQLATFHINIGYLYEIGGNWGKALDSFETAADLVANSVKINSKEANLLRARANYSAGHILAMEGAYEPAMYRCETAFSLLKNQRKTDDLVFALRYLGLTLRYQRIYDRAKFYLEKSINEARKGRKRIPVRSILDLGATYYDEGHEQRRFFKRNLDGMTAQLRAYEFLTEGLELARDAGLRREKADALGRLGRVYEEIGEVRNAPQAKRGRPAQLLRRFDDLSNALQLPEEEDWLYEKRLSSNAKFEKLDTFGRARRLFELSYLEANASGDMHRALHSLMDLGRLAIYQGDLRGASRVTEEIEDFRLDTLHEENLFFIMGDIIKGMIKLSEGDIDRAITDLANGLEDLYAVRGLGQVLLRETRADITDQVSRMGETGIHVCEALIERLTQSGVTGKYSDMIDEFRVLKRELQQQT